MSEPDNAAEPRKAGLPIAKLAAAAVALIGLIALGLQAGSVLRQFTTWVDGLGFWAPLLFVAGYALAWTGHFFVEHNTPATWGYVRWSFLAEFKMFALALTGRMGKEIERLDGEGAAGVDPDSTTGEG